MASEVAEAKGKEAETGVAVAAPANTGFWLKFAAVAGLLVVVMIVQFLVIYLFFGRSENVAVNPNDAAILATENLDDTSTTEIDISPPFNSTNSLSQQGEIHVSFNLHMEVPTHLAEKFNEARKNHKNKIRQSVITIIRNAGIEELNDPYLSVIKRQIREETNKILNQSLVTGVIITDFRKMEQ
ncbi:MAG: flagellar basal body-associated FliL family protein [Planctomycetaceae bacterium]|nr:flagellar basal body-associated FliL family protein [Planctomycetaceae bacterium]